jgi:hypothetical protein
MSLSFIVLGLVGIGICGLLIAAVVASVWVILQERRDRSA